MRFPGSDDIAGRVSSPRSRRGAISRLTLLAAIVVLFFGAGTFISWYVEALWFGSLGYGAVFWKALELKTLTFWAFTAVTFVILFVAFRALRPGGRVGRVLYLNGQPVTFSIQPVITAVSWVVALVVALAAGSRMMDAWATFALYTHAPAPAGGGVIVDPIFGRTVSFYLFTLPVWDLVATWLTTLGIVVVLASLVSVVVGGADEGRGVLGTRGSRAYRGVSFALAAFLLVLAWRVYLARFDRLFEDHTVFSGIGYTDATVLVPGLLIVAVALVLGAAIAAYNAFGPRRLVGLIAALAPAVVVYLVLTVVSWYVTGFIVKPNQLVRERPYIANNIEFTRQAFDLARMTERPFPAEAGIAAVDLANNRETLQNIRLWDWRALQDTLRQIQEIRTYYDFPDIDIDRYRINGEVRQTMVAARELNVERLPESSRNWINERLIYTHGYGVTMNPVNGFTAEGLPELVLSNMPVESTAAEIKVTRPEIYFGELTNADVYVKTRQKEFNYPQGETNSYTAYQGRGGIEVGSGLRRLLLATNRGDLSKVPFSDDIVPESRLLMRRNIRERVRALAPFLTYDLDPYIVVGEDGRLYWLMDGFTSSDAYPYARHYLLGDVPVNYLRNSVKVTVDAYDGSVVFYVFDQADPIIAAYRGVFPTLFVDAAKMPPSVRAHVRYPELLLEVQAAAYTLYHMRDPDVFYNREDLWSVASEVTIGENREQVTRPLEPNFVLMKLPGERNQEFVEILPFTPSNRNNLIGWIGGRSDGEAYGSAIVYDFPKTRLVDGPLQVEARIDQNASLSAQLTLWNQQGSHVRRGSLVVIPVGRALLYAKPIYLQAVHSPMPELRLVVLVLQERLGFGSTFDEAMSSLFGAAGAPAPAARAEAAMPAQEGAAPEAAAAAPRLPAAPGGGTASPKVQQLIEQAARDLADYQRLTAEGRLGEAGLRLESLKRTLEQLRKGETR
jgi:uncharacterized membrane protein (UPF0182 family)